MNNPHNQDQRDSLQEGLTEGETLGGEIEENRAVSQPRRTLSDSGSLKKTITTAAFALTMATGVLGEENGKGEVVNTSHPLIAAVEKRTDPTQLPEGTARLSANRSVTHDLDRAYAQAVADLYERFKASLDMNDNGVHGVLDEIAAMFDEAKKNAPNNGLAALYEKFRKAFRDADIVSGVVDFKAAGVDITALRSDRRKEYQEAYNTVSEAYNRFSAEQRLFANEYKQHLATFERLLTEINGKFRLRYRTASTTFGAAQPRERDQALANWETVELKSYAAVVRADGGGAYGGNEPSVKAEDVSVDPSLGAVINQDILPSEARSTIREMTKAGYKVIAFRPTGIYPRKDGVPVDKATSFSVSSETGVVTIKTTEKQAGLGVGIKLPSIGRDMIFSLVGSFDGQVKLDGKEFVWVTTGEKDQKYDLTHMERDREDFVLPGELKGEGREHELSFGLNNREYTVEFIILLGYK